MANGFTPSTSFTTKEIILVASTSFTTRELVLAAANSFTTRELVVASSNGTSYTTLYIIFSSLDEEEVVDGEKTRPPGKTNSKKENKQDAASNALIATVEDMMTKKDSREEKHRKDKKDHVNTFMDIQGRRLEMEAEKQAKVFEMEAEKQARMLEIEAVNAKTKAKEVALASMMTGVEIMKVDLNTISPRKRPWSEKMLADMLKFDEN
ncbi:C2 domain-containing protein [Hordeum vulgare]|nr:C2 domain-containing protein [Hordeum vulgare]